MTSFGHHNHDGINGHDNHDDVNDDDQDFQRELEDKSLNLIIRKLEGVRVGEEVKVSVLIIIVVVVIIIIIIIMTTRLETLKQFRISQGDPSTSLNK